MKNSVRYPYTYACDLVRQSVSPLEEKVGTITVPTSRLSRADASQIISLVATALGIPKVEVATKLADKYIDKRNRLKETI